MRLAMIIEAINNNNNNAFYLNGTFHNTQGHLTNNIQAQDKTHNKQVTYTDQVQLSL